MSSRPLQEFPSYPLHPSRWIVLIGILIVSCTTMPGDLPPDATTGQAIYASLCQKCHGVKGWGDGPQAQWLYLPAANFHDPASKSKSDDQLLSVIENGVSISPMHSFRKTLTDAQMRDVLAYIRALSQQNR